ncbi:MAG: type I restriction-modification system subunit M [Bacilli bacterium]|nr:type I restriction-modification system subunit M [Bacilli bacterium]MBP3445615.1 type I restriction-modification system subunit M [Bacilli bacterium]
MNNKKEYERDELHKAIWKIANDLRGSVDGWDFKQYVLGFLFYRFISENLTNYINKLEPDDNFDYAKLSDEQAEYGRNETLKEKGFYILPSELFCNVRKKAKNDADLNVTLNNVFNNIENSAKGTDSEDDMKGLFDDIDVNSNKLGNTVKERNDKLVKIIDSIGELPLGNYQDNTIDVFGDAYEYLMTMYASNAGKSGGEFFTPQEVGELLARITLMDKKEVNKVYDPCCGSGGLLLKFAKILGKENVKDGFYGQEVNLTTYNLARINMFLHDINYNKFNIARGDTLIDPKHWDDEPFDAIVSNPPYSIKWEGKSNPLLINDERFAPAGILAPESKADLAFTMHMLSWLSAKGTAAIVEFPGVLYRSNEKGEPGIRRYLVENNFIDTIIQLPENLFFGPSIATCIIVLKKNKKDNSILFVDASDEFIKPGKKNKLTDDNINNILELLKNRTNVEGKSILISNDEILKDKDVNISVGTFLKTEEDDVSIDIVELNNNIQEIVAKQSKVRKELDKIIGELESDYYE